MKEKIIIVLALLMLMISGVLLVGYFKKVPINMAKLGYYLCVEEDEEKARKSEAISAIDRILLCYQDRAVFSSIGTNLVESDIKRPVFYSNLVYDGNIITFTPVNTNKTKKFLGEVKGDIITLTDEKGIAVRYRWMGLPGPKDQPFDYNKDEKAATVEIRANQEKRKRAVIAVCAADFVICVLAFGDVVLCRRKKKRQAICGGET